MSNELVVQLDRYGDYLDEHTADVMTDHTSGGSQLMMERVERRQGTQALVWLIAAAIAVLVGILAIALLTSRRDFATDPDVGVPEIDAWLPARNTADLETLRALTDPTSPQMAWVFQSGATGLDALRLLGQADFVFDCEMSSSEVSETSYRCSRENRWRLAEVIGMDLGGPMEWEIRIAAGGVASYVVAGTSEEYSGHRLPLPVANYLLFVANVRVAETENVYEVVFSVVAEGATVGLLPEIPELDGDLERGVAVALEELEPFVRYVDTFGSPESALEVSQATRIWSNSVGLQQSDPDVWFERLGEMCEEGVWDHDVARRLGARYQTEDIDFSLTPGILPEGVPVHQPAQFVWLIAVEVCRDRFPEGAIEEGPPGRSRAAR